MHGNINILFFNKIYVFFNDHKNNAGILTPNLSQDTATVFLGWLQI